MSAVSCLELDPPALAPLLRSRELRTRRIPNLSSGAFYDASVPYLGAEAVPARFALTMREMHASLPAASSSANAAPAAAVRIGTLTSVKLQPSEHGEAPPRASKLLRPSPTVSLTCSLTFHGLR